MSLISDLTSLATNADSFSAVVEKVEEAISKGVKADTPEGRKIGDFIKNAIPDIQGAPDMIQTIDNLIPDTIQSKFGFTPTVMKFIKEAVGGATVN